MYVLVILFDAYFTDTLISVKEDKIYSQFGALLGRQTATGPVWIERHWCDRPYIIRACKSNINWVPTHLIQWGGNPMEVAMVDERFVFLQQTFISRNTPQFILNASRELLIGRATTYDCEVLIPLERR